MDKADIRIFKVNETHIRIDTEPQINREIRNYFAARPPNFQFMPAYRNGAWDGFIRFYKAGNLLPIGLLTELEKFAKKGRYSFFKSFDDELEIDLEDFVKFIESLEIPFEVRDYQVAAAWSACSKKREAIQLPTGAGKSLIAYIIIRFCLLENLSTLLVVPRTSLVEQMYTDFEEYGWENIHEEVHRIYSGKDKTYDKNLIITTWQSIYKEKKIFEHFGAFIIDEAHHAKSKSIITVAERCKNASYRIGMSATYDDSNTVDWFSVTGSLGPIKSYATFKELEEADYLTGLEINNLFLNYNYETKRMNHTYCYNDYFSEVDFLNKNEQRNDFIIKMTKKIKENTLVLFTRIEHGKEIYERLLEGNKRVFYIDGSIKAPERETIRKLMEINDNVVLVASFGTFAEGVNIKNIHNIVFASNYKSKIKIIQSIGRGLRKLIGKDKLIIYDIIDDLRLETENYINYSWKHYLVRQRVYAKQGFTDIKNIEIRFK